LHVSNPFLFGLFFEVSVDLFEPMVLGSITGKVIICFKERPINCKIWAPEKVYPYPIPSEEGDGKSLITSSAMGDLNR